MKALPGRRKGHQVGLEPRPALRTLGVAMKILLPASKQWKDLTVAERRERRRLRREKQREANFGRAAKMHLARLKTKKEGRDGLSKLEGWFMSGVPAGATGNGGIHSTPGCLGRIGLNTI